MLCPSTVKRTASLPCASSTICSHTLCANPCFAFCTHESVCKHGQATVCCAAPSAHDLLAAAQTQMTRSTFLPKEKQVPVRFLAPEQKSAKSSPHQTVMSRAISEIRTCRASQQPKSGSVPCATGILFQLLSFFRLIYKPMPTMLEAAATPANAVHRGGMLQACAHAERFTFRSTAILSPSGASVAAECCAYDLLRAPPRAPILADSPRAPCPSLGKHATCQTCHSVRTPLRCGQQTVTATPRCKLSRAFTD